MKTKRDNGARPAKVISLRTQMKQQYEQFDRELFGAPLRRTPTGPASRWKGRELGLVREREEAQSTQIPLDRIEVALLGPAHVWERARQYDVRDRYELIFTVTTPGVFFGLPLFAYIERPPPGRLP